MWNSLHLTKRAVFCFVDTNLRGKLVMNSANQLTISEGGSYDRRGQKLFEILEDCTSKLGLVDCSEPSVTDSDLGCVAGMPLTKATLGRMNRRKIDRQTGRHIPEVDAKKLKHF